MLYIMSCLLVQTDAEEVQDSEVSSLDPVINQKEENKPSEGFDHSGSQRLLSENESIQKQEEEGQSGQNITQCGELETI